jgi:hypothetical protein
MNELAGSRGAPAFAVSAVALSVLAWPLGFNLGAFGVIFYEQVFTVVVVSTVALMASFIAPERTSPHRWTVRIVLAAPSAWMILAVVATDSVATAAADPVLGTLGLVVALVSLPYGLYLLAATVTPGLGSVRGGRFVGGLVLIVAIVGVAAFLVGRHNDRFLTCDDFKVSGNDLPANCAQPR